jgi:transcriptional regulator with XRE-family HTH domain
VPSRRGVELASEIGRRIRRQRESLKPPVSQEQLADRAGLHRTYIGHVERGEVNLTVYSLVRLAGALAIDPAELVRGLRPDGRHDD